MPNTEEIEHFLFTFQASRLKHGIVYYPREKNFQSLLEMEMSPEEREKIIVGLEASHYHKGPVCNDFMPGSRHWEFGRNVKGKKIWMKLSLGREEGAVFCLAFMQQA